LRHWQSFTCRGKIHDVQAYHEIAENWEEQLAKLDSHQRRALRRGYDKLVKSGARIEHVPATAESLDRVYDDFVQTHQAYWNVRGYPGHFGAWPGSYEFHHEVAARQLNANRLRLHRVEVDGRCLGYTYGYTFGSVKYRVLQARTKPCGVEKYDFSKIDYVTAINQSISEKVYWLDSMRGKFASKAKLGGSWLPVRSIYLYRDRRWAGMRSHLFRLLARAFDILYYGIWCARISPKLGIRRGPFAKLWIRCCNLGY
jgi:hypothetical protein